MNHGRLLLDGPATAAWNMAVDESLLHQVTLPVLRFYGWSQPVVSLGFFQKTSVVPDLVGFVRRPTGGGLVDHRIGQTYTLVLPKTHPWTELGTEESYRLVHEALALALQDEGQSAHLSPDCAAPHDACFQRPVRHDVLDEGESKIAGAAQRRTRTGLLHQGSVLTESTVFIHHFQKRLAEVLKLTWSESRLTEEEANAARDLQDTKYTQTSWNQNAD